MTAPENSSDVAASVRRRKIRRRLIITAMVAAVLVIGGVLAIILVIRSRKSNALNGVATAPAIRTTIVQQITETGNVNAQTGAEVNIGSQVTGVIQTLTVDIGNKVKAGQVIATMNLPDYVAQYNQAVAAYNVAQQNLNQQVSGVGFQYTTTAADINKAAASLASAQATYKQDVETLNPQVLAAQAAVNQATANYKTAAVFLTREQQLLRAGYVAAQDVDNAQATAGADAALVQSAQQNLQLTKTRTATTLQTDQATIRNDQAVLTAARAETAQNTIKLQQVAAARDALQQARENVAFEQAQYNKTIIRSPISGTVVSLSAFAGETVAAGLQAPTLVTVVDLHRLQVDAYVDETDIGGVRLGQPATVTVDAYPNLRFAGKVVKISGAGALQQNVVTYDTTIELLNPRGLLKPGMTATTTIVVSAHNDVVAVPIEAIKYVGTTPVVYVVQGTKISPHRVVTGVSDNTNTQIISGVQAGDIVVLAGYPPSANGPGPRSLLGPSGGGRGGGGGGR